MIDKYLNTLAKEAPFSLILLVIAFWGVWFGLSWIMMKLDKISTEREERKWFKERFGVEWDDYLAQHTGRKQKTGKK